MNQKGRKIIATFLIAAWLLLPSKSHSQDLPSSSSGTSGSANTILNFFQSLFELDDYSNPLIWVAYSGVGTWVIYRQFLQGAIDFARGTRQAYLRDLEKIERDFHKKKDAYPKMEALVKGLNQNVALAQKLLPKFEYWLGDKLLDAVIRTNNSQLQNSAEIGDRSDFQKIQKWLDSPSGQDFLNTPAGKSWKKGYDALFKICVTNIEKPLQDIFALAQDFYGPSNPISAIESSHSLPGGSVGDFSTLNPTTHERLAISINEIPNIAKSNLQHCKQIYLALTQQKRDLRRRIRPDKFWWAPKNRNPIALAGSATISGAIVTYYLSQKHHYQSRRKELEQQAKQATEASIDISGWLSSHEGRSKMAPYYEVFMQSLREMEPEIVRMFERSLTEDERQELKIAELVQHALVAKTDPNGNPLYPHELISAVAIAARRAQGDRTAPQALLKFLNDAKSNSEMRDGLFRAFNKDVLLEFVNKKWPDIAVGQASDHFAIGTLRRIQNRVVELLEGDRDLTAPNPATVPPAPGVIPEPTEQLRQPEKATDKSLGGELPPQEPTAMIRTKKGFSSKLTQMPYQVHVQSRTPLESPATIISWHLLMESLLTNGTSGSPSSHTTESVPTMETDSAPLALPSQPSQGKEPSKTPTLESLGFPPKSLPSMAPEVSSSEKSSQGNPGLTSLSGLSMP